MQANCASAAIAAGLALGAAVGSAGAQEHEWRLACTHDAIVHCFAPAIRRDRPAVKACMIAKLDKLSDPCRQVIIVALADPVPVASTTDKLRRKDP
jgi:hypothetical protein